MASKHHVVLLCGFKRSGKDTIAKVLQQHYGYTHLKIATPLKEGLKAMFNFTDQQLEGDEKDKLVPSLNKTPRDVMKFVGTDLFQMEIQKFMPHVGRNFWVNSVISRIEQAPSEQKRTVISDLRFHHEIRAFMAMWQQRPYDMQVSVVKVIRNNSPRYYNVDKHESELEHTQFCYDYVINNDVYEEFVEKIHRLHKMLTETASSPPPAKPTGGFVLI